MHPENVIQAIDTIVENNVAHVNSRRGWAFEHVSGRHGRTTAEASEHVRKLLESSSTHTF